MDSIVVLCTKLKQIADELYNLVSRPSPTAGSQDEDSSLIGTSNVAAVRLGELSKPSQLTSRETEILPYICYGLSNRQISDIMHISLPTVRTHVASILQKLQFPDRHQLIHRYLVTAGLITESG